MNEYNNLGQKMIHNRCVDYGGGIDDKHLAFYSIII